MAKEGSVAPKERINVTFKPATGGAQEELELPLKLMVLGDFTQRADDRKIEDRKPIAIDKNSFDEVLAKQELNLTFSVPNRLQDEATDEELAVQLNINSMKDFNPANLVEQVPELKKLMELRDALSHSRARWAMLRPSARPSKACSPTATHATAYSVSWDSPRKNNWTPEPPDKESQHYEH